MWQYIGYGYMIIGFIVAFIYGVIWGRAYVKKNNIPNPRDIIDKRQKAMIYIFVGVMELIAMILAFILWPLSLFELIKHKGVKNV